MALFIKRLCNLITIKSLVTILLTIMFNILAYRGDIDSVVFVSVYNLVIGFYFGTQKIKDEGNKINND